MRKNATNYDGEILAVCEATTHLLPAGLAPAKVVFFIDFPSCNFGFKHEYQVMFGSPAMKEPTKKPSREPSRINRKFP
ncbi:hypothetical protein TNCV_4669921 [Trichonephila clavipes]|nr:hypothetical protein TNCV_4669921 [Trichonephila clavipes]